MEYLRLTAGVSEAEIHRYRAKAVYCRYAYMELQMYGGMEAKYKYLDIETNRFGLLELRRCTVGIVFWNLAVWNESELKAGWRYINVEL